MLAIEAQSMLPNNISAQLRVLVLSTYSVYIPF